MKWTRRNSDSPVITLPHFTAIILEYPIPQHRLMIPKKCAMKLGNELLDNAILVDPNRQSWKVKLKRESEKIWFSEGLQGFLNHYSVQFLYTLHFGYEGNSIFSVFICDESGSEIDYPIKSGLDNKDNLLCKLEHECNFEICHGDLVNKCVKRNGNFVLKRAMKRSKRRRVKRANSSVAYRTRSRVCKTEEKEVSEEKECGIVGDIGVSSLSNVRVNRGGNCAEIIAPRSRCVQYSRETTEAIRAANSCKLKNPSFMAVLTPYSVRQGWVSVPVEFVRRHFNFDFEDIQLQARNRRKKWPARCYTCKYRPSSLGKRIGKGWALFSSEEKLTDGDVCVFELVKKGYEEATLRVWIYRAADFAEPNRNS